MSDNDDLQDLQELDRQLTPPGHVHDIGHAEEIGRVVAQRVREKQPDALMVHIWRFENLPLTTEELQIIQSCYQGGPCEQFFRAILMDEFPEDN